MPQPPSPRRQPQLGRGLFIAGMVAFALGVLAIAAIFVMFLAGGSPPLFLYLASMLSPLGLFVGVVSAMVTGRRAKAPTQ